jgi:hypothetical protein
MCVQSQFRNISFTNTGKKIENPKEKMGMKGKPVYVIHRDGSIVRYKYVTECVHKEHTDFATVAKYLDKDWTKWNMTGVQFRSKRPRKR